MKHLNAGDVDLAVSSESLKKPEERTLLMWSRLLGVGPGEFAF